MKRIYEKPQAKVIQINVCHIIALSGGEQTTSQVNDPEIEVDADQALTKKRYQW